MLGIVLFCLSACGGSGSSSEDEVEDNETESTTAAPEAPTLTLTPKAIKTFSFNWSDVSDETEYRLLENPDGESGYTEIATIDADTTEHELDVFLPGRINASYILQACNSGGCSDSSAVHVSGTLAEAVGYVKASNTSESTNFGVSIAVSRDGKTIAVGAHRENSDARGIDGDQTNSDASNSGAVYVFALSDGTWSQQAYVKASNTSAGDEFGFSVALSHNGDTLAVGAMRENSDATGIGGDQENSDANNSGAVYIFTRSNEVWSQQAYVKASNTDSGAHFGFSVALSDDGNTLAVGARIEDSDATGIDGDQSNTDAASSGAVYVFTRTGAFWSQQAYVKASNTGEGHRFGYSLALSSDGNTLAVGAYQEDSDAEGIDGNQDNNNKPDSGAVYVFTRDSEDWQQQAYVKASNTAAGDEFGISVALSGDGNTLAVGATGESSNATGIDGTQNNSDATNSGAVYVFTRSSGAWSQQAYVKASDTATGNQFGEGLALSIDGDTLAVGAIDENSNAIGINGEQNNNDSANSGSVYVFVRNGDTWSQQSYVKASNTRAGHAFGRRVALSGDGKLMAVGSSRENSNATGIGGNLNDNTASNSGAVYLY
ncbi:MAG: FG-GAP repeat protein [Natronospirillum sp.]|uniref:FG-GAP repeat protein n=1 Tax=Natronospirillum sp. TaxID=2812955 RepID=UPI0025F03ABE|nr:FG-GAP repeat protein [Natronospirillum sp.]MCH8551001.1 FG-GAP repeat protein [Natronospirillum sp.]